MFNFYDEYDHDVPMAMGLDVGLFFCAMIFMGIKDVNARKLIRQKV